MGGLRLRTLSATYTGPLIGSRPMHGRDFQTNPKYSFSALNGLGLVTRKVQWE